MIFGKYSYAAGASGTVNLSAGATVKQIIVHATSAGSMTIFGGASIPIPAGMTSYFRFDHECLVAGENAAGSVAIVFTGTDSYYVETIGSGV